MRRSGFHGLRGEERQGQRASSAGAEHPSHRRRPPQAQSIPCGTPCDRPGVTAGTHLLRRWSVAEHHGWARRDPFGVQRHPYHADTKQVSGGRRVASPEFRQARVRRRVGPGQCIRPAAFGLTADPKPGACGDHWRRAAMNGVDDLGTINALQVDACDPEVRVSGLSLDDYKRHAFVRHLGRVRMLQLVRREPPADSGSGGSVMKLLARCRRLPVPPGGRAVDHAQERSDRQPPSRFKPWLELPPRPSIHADLTPPAAFAAGGRRSRREPRRGRSPQAQAPR